MAGNVMVMAGGTGGHVFPALAVADELRSRGWSVFWLGTRDSFESRVVPEHGIDMEWIDIKGFRGKGLFSRLMMPLRLL
ncbi:MAG: glycosyltransferase, partial [Gammaproteobacteria bacterium]